MGSKKLHPVRFSEEQVEFIELMTGYGIDEASESRERDILSTIKKSVRKNRKALTEDGTLSNLLAKRAPITGWPHYILPPAHSTPPPDRGETKGKKPWIPPFIPPGQGIAKKCYHLNIRFRTKSTTCYSDLYSSSEICPDCLRNVWPSDMINIILDSMSEWTPRLSHHGRNGHSKK